MRRFDHGLFPEDIEAFQAKLIGDAVENAYIWRCMEPGEFRDELRDDIMEKLAACYMLSTWTDQAFPEPEHEPFEDD